MDISITGQCSYDELTKFNEWTRRLSTERARTTDSEFVTVDSIMVDFSPYQVGLCISGEADSTTYLIAAIDKNLSRVTQYIDRSLTELTLRFSNMS